MAPSPRPATPSRSTKWPRCTSAGHPAHPPAPSSGLTAAALLAVDTPVDKTVEDLAVAGDNMAARVDDVWITKNFRDSSPYPLALTFKAE